MSNVNVVPLQRRRVEMVTDGGTVYGKYGDSHGEAIKGSVWHTVHLEWKPKGGEDEVLVYLEDSQGYGTFAFPTEFKLIL